MCRAARAGWVPAMTSSFRCIAAALMTCAALAAPAHAVQHPSIEGEEAPGRSDQGGHPTAFTTLEEDCIEVNSFRLADRAQTLAALPADRVPFLNAAGRAFTVFVDYTCESHSIDDVPGRRTTVSWWTVVARKDGQGPLEFWTLAYGTDNPLLVQRLRKLGIDARYLPRTTVETEQLDASTLRVTTTYVDDRPGAGLAYTRTYDAPEPSPARFDRQGGAFLTKTEDGVFRQAFRNFSISDLTRPFVSETFAEGSLPRAFGTVDIFRQRGSNYAFIRGSWTSTLERLPG
jgi:hypothetical protein